MNVKCVFSIRLSRQNRDFYFFVKNKSIQNVDKLLWNELIKYAKKCLKNQQNLKVYQLTNEIENIINSHLCK